MKKIFLVLIMGVLCLSLTGCGEKNVEGTLEEIMTKVYADIPDDERPMVMNIEVTEENVEHFLGTTDIEYESALASEPMMTSIAYSVVLVRTKENANIEAVKTKIKENVDPRKWICVEVDEDDVIVKNKGNLIILIMVGDEATRTKIEKAFDNL